MANGSFEGTSPYSRLEETASATSRESQKLADRARQGVEQATGYVREGVEQATGYVKDAMERTRGKVAEYRDNGVDRVKEDVISYTREQPVTALLIAAAAGLLIGWLSMMGGRRSSGFTASH